MTILTPLLLSLTAFLAMGALAFAAWVWIAVVQPACERRRARKLEAFDPVRRIRP